MNVVLSADAMLKQKAAAAITPPATISFYTETPNFELTIDEFEVFALKRLRVLRTIEQSATMKRNADKSIMSLNKTIKEEGLQHPGEVLDVASHFILRMSYSQNEELRRWFLKYETQLFLHRLKALKPNEMMAAVSDHCNLEPISSDRVRDLQHHLEKLTPYPERTAFYAVPFTQVLDLVARRQCFVKAGIAYIDESKVFAILASQFRAQLSRSLAQRAPLDHAEATRLQPLIENLDKVLLVAEDAPTDGVSELRADNVAKHKAHMPLCMRQLQTGMEKDKKLKHWGRLQYGLFLKTAGLSMEDSLAFFERHFTAVTGEQFRKEYSYNIRHMYGKEGKRGSYGGYNCSKIILGNAPSSGHHHGCPYKHYDVDNLRHTLDALQIGDAASRHEIVQLKDSGHFQLACMKHFEVSHPGAVNNEQVPMENVANHPNAWFKASIAYSKLDSSS